MMWIVLILSLAAMSALTVIQTPREWLKHKLLRILWQGCAFSYPLFENIRNIFICRISVGNGRTDATRTGNFPWQLTKTYKNLPQNGRIKRRVVHDGIDYFDFFVKNIEKQGKRCYNYSEGFERTDLRHCSQSAA